MKMLKKGMSLLLTVAMLLGCMTFTATAAGEDYTFGVKVQLYDEANHEILEDPITEASAGDVIVVTFFVRNNTGSNVMAGAYDAYLLCDQNVFDTYVDVDDLDWDGPFYEGYSSDLSASSFTAGLSAGVLSMHGATSGGFRINKNDLKDVGCVALKVADDAEATTVDFAFDSTAANKLADKNENVLTVGIDEVTSIDILGVLPTLQSVEPAVNSVTVEGGSAADQTVQASALSAKGTNITSSVTWTLEPADQGVSIDETGLITIAADAAAADYAVTATPISEKALGDSATSYFTVYHAASVLTTLTVSGPESTTVPATEASPKNENYSLTGADQFGEEYDLTSASPVWSVESDTDGFGITIADGVMTLTNNSKACTVTVKAAIDTVEGTLDVTVTKPDEDLVTDITANHTGESPIIIVPAAGGSDNTWEGPIAVEATNCYGERVDVSEFEWSITDGSSAVNGVTVEQTGAPYINGGDVYVPVRITVTESAADWVPDTTGVVTYVSARYSDTTSNTVLATIARDAAVATSIVISKNGVELTGDSDIVIIPRNDTPNTYQYTAAVYDQYGDPFDTADLAFATANEKVAYDAGTVTVSIGAVQDSTYTLTATYSTLETVVNITAKDLEITWPTTLQSSGDYGSTWNDIVAFEGGSVELAGENIPGTFSVLDGDTCPNVGDKFHYRFVSDDGNYDVTSGEFSAEVNPVTLNVVPNEGSSITYGDAPAANGVTYEGFVNGDDETVLGGTLGYDFEYNLYDDVGTYLFTPDGLTSTNYTINYSDGNLIVIPKDLTVTAGDLAVSKTYDGTTDPGTASGGALGLDGVVNADDVSVTYETIGDYATANVGTGLAVTVSGLALTGAKSGNYTIDQDSIEITAGEITKAVLTADMVSFEPSSATYDGTAQGVVVTLNDPYTGLGAMTVYYDGSGTEPTEAATYAITISADEGENFNAVAPLAIGSFEITPKDISSAEIDGIDPNGYPYTGAAIEPSFTVVDGGTDLVLTQDYTVAITDNVNYGEATITVTGQGNYTGELIGNFMITKVQPILGTDYTVTLPAGTVTYDGDAHPATVEVLNSEIGQITLKYNGETDEPVGAGTYDVTADIAESDNYAAMTNVTVGTINIDPRSLTDADVTVELESDSFTYTGDEIQPAVTVTYGTTELDPDTDYTVDYASNVEVSDDTATVTVNGTGNFTDSVLKTFDITKADPEQDVDFTATIEDKVYSGTAQTVTVEPITGRGIGAITIHYYAASDPATEIDPIDAGDYVVKIDIAESDNFNGVTGLEVGTFTIDPKPIDEDYAVDGIDPNGYPYTGAAIEPAFTFTVGGNTMTKDTDYSVAYGENVNAGDTSFTLTGQGNYTGELEVSFTINPIDAVADTDYSVIIYGTVDPAAAYDATANPITYDGLEHGLTILSWNDGIGEYSVTYNDEDDVPVNAGTYTAVLHSTGSQNYNAFDAEIGTYEIGKAGLVIASVETEDREYDTTTDVTITGFEYASGSEPVNGEELELGTDILMTGTAEAAFAGEQRVRVAVRLADTELANNYTVSPASFEYSDGVTVTISRAVPDVSLTAAGAEYTGLEYDYDQLLTPDYGPADELAAENKEDDYTVTFESWDGELEQYVSMAGVPVDAGLYRATYTWPELSNYESASASAEFEITKAALTVTAADNEIVYGDEPAGNGVTYDGFVNNEDESVLGGELDYDFDYAQYDDTGSYSITPKGLTSGNYEITFEDGALTVGALGIGVTWPDDTVVYYDGTEHTPEATSSDLLNDDDVTVTVEGSGTEVGEYASTATGLTGDKAGNYYLTGELGYEWEIAYAITDALPNSETLTAEIDQDNLTITVTGRAAEDHDLTITDENQNEYPVVDGQVEINGVTYTVDTSGVTETPAGVDPALSSTDVEAAPGSNIPADVIDTVQNGATVEGLEDALEGAYEAAAEGDKPAGTDRVTVEFQLRMTLLSYEDLGDGNKSLKFDIQPYIITYYYDVNGDEIDRTEVPAANEDIASPIKVTTALPDDMSAENVFVKHTTGDFDPEGKTIVVPEEIAVGDKVPAEYEEEMEGCQEIMAAEMSNDGGVNYASVELDHFSTTEFYNDPRTATINLHFSDGTTETIDVGPEDLNNYLPTNAKNGYTYQGWLYNGVTYLAITDELLDAINGQIVDLNASMKSNQSGEPDYPILPYTYTITAYNTPGGLIFPNGDVHVVRNGAKTFTMTAEEGYHLVALIVDGHEIAPYATYSFDRVNRNHSIFAVFEKDSAQAPETEPDEPAIIDESVEDVNPFTDVADDAYYYEPVLWAVENELTLGTTPTTFSPDGSCTRAQMVTFLWRASGCPEPTIADNPFEDVTEGDYFYKAVLWAVEEGITKGTSATTFTPYKPVTRAQAVTFLYRLADGKASGDGNAFTDVLPDAYYAEAVQWAVDNGITKGTTLTTFSPDQDCTRAQIVTFMYRYFA